MAKKSGVGVSVGDEAPQATQAGAQAGKRNGQGKAAGGASAAPGRTNKPKSITESVGLETVKVPKKKGWQPEKQFKPGQSGNPAGRPKGSRNKLSESFIARMHADFEQHGDTVIEAVRTESPGEYLRIIASIVPKQFGIEEGTQDCFLQVWTAISEGRA